MKKIIIAIALLLSFNLSAETDWQAKIPAELKSWIPWVLKNEVLDKCVDGSGENQVVVCNWYPQASLELSKNSAEFSQEVIVEKKGRVQLPRAEGSWPQDVKVAGQSVPVLNTSGQASIWLEKGSYQVSGRLKFSELPASISFPPSTGVISVTLNDQKMPQPQIDENGSVWLKKQASELPEEVQRDFAAYQIFRKITDSIPVKLETVIRINIGGRAREIALPNMLLGTKAYEIGGTLPARLDKNNRLFLRASAGNWEVRIKSLMTAPFAELKLTTVGDELPQEEIWSFEPLPELRSVRIGGADGIDPQRADLPAEWSRLPAYIIKSGVTLTASDEKRADIKAQENQLGISRSLKLHSAGDAYSVSDSISGTVYSDGRLNADSDVTLGSANINGSDQAITKLAGGLAGVEVRTGPLTLNAESRIKGDIKNLSVTGWDATFSNPGINLYLPFGWKLLHVSGADTVYGSWVGKWDLLDIFLVLTASILAFKLYGRNFGLITAVALVTLEQDFQFAKTAIFLMVLAALLKVITKGFFAGLIKVIKGITIVVLFISFAVFGIERIKTAIHPQLENQYSSYSSYSDYSVMPQRVESRFNQVAGAPLAAPYEMEGDLMEAAKDESSSWGGRSQRPEKKSKGYMQNYINDSSNIAQTGFGKVELKGANYSLSWKGPVTPKEKLRIYYLTPFWNLVLAFLQVILGALAILKIALGFFKPKVQMFAPAAIVLIFGASFMQLPFSAQAEDTPYPSQEILQELKNFALKNINERAACYPKCAAIGVSSIKAEGKNLTVNVQVQSEAEAAVPLIEKLNNIELKGAFNAEDKALPVTREKGQLLVKVTKGITTVRITGQIRGVSASFSFVEQPATVEADSNDWQVSGITNLRGKDIRLEKVITAETTKAAASEDTLSSDFGVSAFLTPFIHIERTIDFAANWTVSTNIQLENPAGSVQTIYVPLLGKEAVTTPGIDVENSKVKLTFLPGQQVYSWESILEIQNEIELLAAQDDNIQEVWNVGLSNLWHAEFDGTPRIQTPENLNSNIAQWIPRPGEKLTVRISRPQGVPGPTKTINQVQAKYLVGGKIVEATLSLKFKSSIGQPHSFNLPAESKIKQVRINGQNITSYSLSNNVIGFDLAPGEQEVEISWTQPVGGKIKYSPDKLDLKAPAVNLYSEVQLQENRWILWTGGPTQGPAVLFWGLFPIILIAAVIIGKSGLTPLGTGSAILLMLGLSMQPLTDCIIVFGFFLLLGLRGRKEINRERRIRSNFIQLALVIWAITAVSSLISAIHSGLLGSPFMRIAGNGSYNHLLKWYQDVSEGVLSKVGVISLPIFCYRIFMLLWALWLAFSVIRWSLWVWKNFSFGGAWAAKMPKAPTPPPVTGK